MPTMSSMPAIATTVAYKYGHDGVQVCGAHLLAYVELTRRAREFTRGIHATYVQNILAKRVFRTAQPTRCQRRPLDDNTNLHLRGRLEIGEINNGIKP